METFPWYNRGDAFEAIREFSDLKLSRIIICLVFELVNVAGLSRFLLR
jgi:hypothetical protein